jgi:hypothetical protein
MRVCTPAVFFQLTDVCSLRLHRDVIVAKGARNEANTSAVVRFAQDRPPACEYAVVDDCTHDAFTTHD